MQKFPVCSGDLQFPRPRFPPLCFFPLPQLTIFPDYHLEEAQSAQESREIDMEQEHSAKTIGPVIISEGLTLLAAFNSFSSFLILALSISDWRAGSNLLFSSLLYKYCLSLKPIRSNQFYEIVGGGLKAWQSWLPRPRLYDRRVVLEDAGHSELSRVGQDPCLRSN